MHCSQLHVHVYTVYLSLLSLTDLTADGNSNSATDSFFRSSHTITTHIHRERGREGGREGGEGRGGREGGEGRGGEGRGGEGRGGEGRGGEGRGGEGREGG